MNAATEMDRLLAEHGAVLVRQSKHLVYRLPNGNSFTRSKTQYEGKAQHVELGNLRRALGVTGQQPQSKGEERGVEYRPTEVPVTTGCPEPAALAPEPLQQEPDSLKQRIEAAIARAEQEQETLLAAAQKVERRVQMLKALVPFSEEVNAEDVLRAIMKTAPPPQPQPVPAPEPPQAITERVQVTRQLVLAATQTFQEPFTVNDVMALMVNGHQIDGGERGRVRASIAQAMATLHERGELVKHQEHFGRRQTIWRKAQLNGNGHSNGVGTRA
jgi:hypothetical protein